MSNQFKLIVGAVALVIGCIIFSIINPFSWNDGGNRTVVQQTGGKQFVQFEPGVFYSGFFAKETEWPNQISVMFTKKEPNYDLVDNAIEVGDMSVMFSDRFTAEMKGITQYILPSDEKNMILIHNTHRTPESLVQKRLAAYTKECIQSAAQLMTADMHSSGGRAQMSQDFNDQLRNGVFLSTTKEVIVFDSIDNEKKRVFETYVQLDKNGQQKRKTSSIKEYGITVADAQVTDVTYDGKFLDRRAKLIDASTKTATSKADLQVAQQAALTAKAQGEKSLVDIEYKRKQDQMQQVVDAQTQVMLAGEDKKKQQIAKEAAIEEAAKIKILADADAYSKQRAITADNALEMRLKYQAQMNKDMWENIAKYQGAWVPTTIMGGGANNYNPMEMMMNLQMMNQVKK